MGKEKEKIGIEKLIELLNEYDSGWDYDDYYGPYQYGQDRDAYQYGKYYLVSRNYGFIKWLVENNKIDFTKDNIEEFGYYGTEWHCDKYDNILMNLAIQDNPIEFLVSILKYNEIRI